MQQQLREPRLGEERHDSIKRALDHARRAHSWRTHGQLEALAWRLLDENPKTRIKLTEAAAIADAALEALPAQFAHGRPRSASASVVPPAPAAPAPTQASAELLVAAAADARPPPAQPPSAELQAARKRRLRFRYAPD